MLLGVDIGGTTINLGLDEKGIVYQAANISSWDEVPLKEELEYRFQLPVHVNNDSNCFALGAAARLDRQYPVLGASLLQ